MMYTAIIQTTRAHHNIFTAEPEGDDIKFFSVLIICKYAVSLCVCVQWNMNLYLYTISESRTRKFKHK